MLTAQITLKGALRHTPAGLPALDVSLKHGSSEVQQLGQTRILGFELRARAVGPLAQPLLQAELGVEHEFAGFLASARNGRGIVFNIQSIELNQRGTQHAPAPR